MGKNMNRKSWNKKSVVAGMTALAVLAAGAGMSEVNVYAAENMQPKEEVVYVMTGADGTVESVNVVNIFGKGDVTDYGDYSTVKMLNATDAISLENGVVTFSTQKEKVYYQGTLENAQIPWKISVKYSLDGKEISPDELAGSTGQLDIALKVEKNDACRGEFYEDYALQVNMTLSTQNCENISAEGATEALVEGSGKLTEGSASLRQGTADLYDGIVSLDDGAKELNDGTKEFYEKTDGMDSEIEGKIDDMLNTISRSDAEIRSFVSEKNTNVESVQFVIKTGAVEKPEAVQTVEAEPQQLSLWEKFLRLFGR